VQCFGRGGAGALLHALIRERGTGRDAVVRNTDDADAPETDVAQNMVKLQ